MKFHATIVLTAFTSVIFAAGAPKKTEYKVHVRASDRLIDVGNVDLFAATWQAIYNEAGNKESVTIDTDHYGQLLPCHNDRRLEVTMHTYIEGAWADIGGVHHESRDAMIDAAWKTLEDMSSKRSRNIRLDCCFSDEIDVNQDCKSILKHKNCEDGTCSCPHHPRVFCSTLSTGHEVPSHVNAYMYVNGVPRDHLYMQFSSTKAQGETGGCGIVGSLASAFAGYAFPAAYGAAISTGIDLICDK